MILLRKIASLIMPAITIVVAGCSSNPSKQIGSPTSNVSIVSISNLDSQKGTVRIKGKMVDKCPTAACWLHVKDSSGSIKVDLKAAGFTATDIPVNREITVTGSYVGGDDKHFDGTGIVY